MKSIVRTEQGAVLALEPTEAQNMATKIARALEQAVAQPVLLRRAAASVAPVLPRAAADRRPLARRSADPRPHRSGGGARLIMETTRFRGQTVEDAVAAACVAHGAEADIVATQLVAARGLRGLVGLREVEVTVAMTATGPRQTSARRPAPSRRRRAVDRCDQGRLGRLRAAPARRPSRRPGDGRRSSRSAGRATPVDRPRSRPRGPRRPRRAARRPPRRQRRGHRSRAGHRAGRPRVRRRAVRAGRALRRPAGRRQDHDHRQDRGARGAQHV